MQRLLFAVWIGLIALSGSSCSLTFLTQAPEAELWDQVDENCTRLPILPIVDASIGGVLGLYGVVFGAYFAPVIGLPFLGAGAVMGYSSYYGFTESAECRKYLRYRREKNGRKNQQKNSTEEAPPES